MKISHHLPQFNNVHAILVTMGNHHGIIYRALNGEIEKIDELRIEQPQYSDNEGSFRRGSGDSVSIGSVLESKKGEYEKRFSKEIADKVLEYFNNNSVNQIFLFQPKDINHLIEGDWNNEIKKNITLRFYGNYVSDTPDELLDMIKKEWENKSKIKPTGIAKKILDKFRRQK